MIQWLRVYDLAEEPTSISSTHMGQLRTAYDCRQFRGPNTSDLRGLAHSVFKN